MEVPPWFQQAPVFWLVVFTLEFAVCGMIGHKIRMWRQARKTARRQAAWEDAV